MVERDRAGLLCLMRHIGIAGHKQDVLLCPHSELETSNPEVDQCPFK